MNSNIYRASIWLALTVTSIYLLFSATVVPASQGQIVTETLNVSKSDIVGLPREQIGPNTNMFVPSNFEDVISDVIVDLPQGVIKGSVDIKSREHSVIWFETIDPTDPLGVVRGTTVSPAQGDTFTKGSVFFNGDAFFGEFAGTRNIIEILDESGAYVEQVRLFTFLNAYTFARNFPSLSPSIVVFSGDQPPDYFNPVFDWNVAGAAYISEVNSNFQLQFERVRETTPFQPQPIPSTMVWSLLLLVLMLWAASYLYFRRSDMR